ncbi:L-rhamnose catabolism isomerase [Lichenicola cladoniae]|uniref:L-rhamnose catabolism isomerase n=1 Tax=Lichenicola cladoniae TaxID=1484109 RepID=A0A6M8HT59_9PROT|nr:L-rhamnose catabolism isomerase [Lichenicola cladoniae]NPD67783.1 L-rhamnose catabolism isomerase [Acetobacteraceae bacterium]QKE91704.1 L-rhamnose catabolism isomerase [Lichenicola cladoniae]
MNEIIKIRPADPDFRAEQNAALNAALQEDYEILGRRMARRGIDIETVTELVSRFGVAVPSWGTGTGGTRFARFPGGGEPANVFDKIADCAVINSLTGATPAISPHFPWDEVADFAELRQYAATLGLGFDAVNSNTFQDHPSHGDHPLSYKFGSLSHTDPAVRAQAIRHNIRCIEAGEQLGSKALTIWIGDGSNFPGQSHFGRSFDRYIDSVKQIATALPPDWSVFLEHKIYEPAFYSTVIQDWGSSLLAAQEVGPQASCLVDLGHHAPNVNIEMIVSRLIHAGKLAGFHFNDSKYGDDDLDAGAIDPFRLFLVFNELVDVEAGSGFAKAPAYMIDQSHNVTDPIESLISSAIEIQRAYAQALLVDRAALVGFQDTNDPMMANQELKRAFTTDVAPILAMARAREGAAIEPLAAYRASGYRQACIARRPVRTAGGGGIV